MLTSSASVATEEELESSIRATIDKLKQICEIKGMETMASSHEIYGLLLEEAHKNSKTGQILELQDIAISAIFEIASISSGGTDW